MWPTNTAPNGHLLCDGSLISRTTYANLFSVIGTTFGAGDGSTTFNLPNLKGKIPVGYNASETEFNTLGETGGEKAHTLTTAEIPAHNHKLNDNSILAYYGGIGTTGTGGTTLGRSVDQEGGIAIKENTGGGGSHNNLQPYIVLNYIIKY